MSQTEAQDGFLGVGPKSGFPRLLFTARHGRALKRRGLLEVGRMGWSRPKLSMLGKSSGWRSEDLGEDHLEKAGRSDGHEGLWLSRF